MKMMMTTMMRTTAGAAYGRGEGKGELRQGRMIETFWYRKIESIHLDHGLEGGCWSKIFDYDAFSFGGVWIVSRSRGLLVFLLLLLLLLLLPLLHLHLHLPLLLLSSSFSFVRMQVFWDGM